MVGLLALTFLSPPPSEEETKWTSLDEMSRASIRQLIVTHNKTSHTIDLSGQSPQWQGHITPLDSKQIEAIVTEVLEVSCGNKLSGPLDEYGLDVPSWTLTLTGNDQSRTLQIGHKSSLSSHHYIDCGPLGGPRLSRYAFSLPSQFEDFIDTSLIGFNPEAIEKIVFSNDTVFERIEGSWQLSSPYRVPLDSAEVQTWLKEIRDCLLYTSPSPRD